MASWQGTSPRASLVRCSYLWLGDSLHRTIVSHMVEPSLLAWFVIASAYQSGPNFDSMVLGLRSMVSFIYTLGSFSIRAHAGAKLGTISLVQRHANCLSLTIGAPVFS
jgi:hypothetical protein